MSVRIMPGLPRSYRGRKRVEGSGSAGSRRSLPRSYRGRKLERAFRKARPELVCLEAIEDGNLGR